MTDQKPITPDESNDGVEPEEESGAGYGNHAPDVPEQPEDGDNKG